jgi:hypothetical protein
MLQVTHPVSLTAACADLAQQLKSTCHICGQQWPVKHLDTFQTSILIFLWRDQRSWADVCP